MAPTPSGPANPGPAGTPAGNEPPGAEQLPPEYETQPYERDGIFGHIADAFQRFGLAEGLTMRPAANMPVTNARSFEHPQLAKMIKTSASTQVDQLGELWNQLGNDIMNFGANLERIADHDQAVWKGEAGNAARNMLTGLAQWSQNTGRGVQYMGTTMRTQADAAGQAERDMPEPVPYDPAVYQNQINSTNNPIEWLQILGDAREQADRHDAAHEEAIRVTETYSAALRGTNGTMPAFAPPPEFGNGDTGLTTGVPTPGGAGSGTAPGVGGGTGGAGIGTGAVPPGTGNPPNPDEGPPAPTQPQGPQGPPLIPGPGVPGSPPGGPGVVGPGGGGVSGVPGYLPAAGLGGAGTGGRGSALGGGRGFGPRGSGSVHSGSNPGGRGGFGATDAAERAAGTAGAGRAAAGAAGRGLGAGGFPMAGGSRGQGAEDTEHRRPSYLMETEDIWGDGRKVAPPVIGEDPPEYYR